MSKTFKWLLVIGAIFLAVGIALFCVALSAVNWDFSVLSDTKIEQKTYREPTDASFDRVELYFGNADIEIYFTEDIDTLTVEYPQLTDQKGRAKNEVTLTEEENGITMIEKMIWHRNLFSVFGFADPKVKVYLPMERTYHLAIFSDNGAITVETNNDKDENGNPIPAREGFQASYVHLQSDNGSIRFSDTSYIACQGVFHCRTNNGRISLGKVDCESLYAETDNGEIVLYGGSVTRDVKLLSDNGAIRINGDLRAATLEIENDNGMTYSCGALTVDRISVENDNGKISLQGSVNATEIFIESSNGDIHACVVGNRSDYSIDVDTDNGSCNVSNQSGGSRRMKLESDNGDIQIVFLGESYVAK